MAINVVEIPPGTREIDLRRVVNGRIHPQEPDTVAVEEPLEIRLGFDNHPRQVRTLSITMRTPGQDRELAAGFLFTEGIVSDREEISAILLGRNLAQVELHPGVEIVWPNLERHVYTSSSCGVCGTTSIEAVQRRAHAPLETRESISPRVLTSLPRLLRQAQQAFEHTGGLHAAALFTFTGELRAAFEDVGRHNALDKLIGSHFLSGDVPASDSVLLVSGRASFELVQKALSAGIPLLAAVGAPSSLAIDLAADAGMTLAGFTREDRFNIYSGASRILETE